MLTQADKWGWRLDRYRSIGGAYTTRDGVVLLISMDECCQQRTSLLWNPMAGTTEQLDLDQRRIFARARLSALIDENAVLRPIPLAGGGKLVQASDLATTRCAPPFDRFFRAYDGTGRLIRAFFIIRKLPAPATLTVPICNDTEAPYSVKMLSEAEDPVVWLAPLPDGTLLFWQANGGYLMRLDAEMHAHSTVGGQILVLDASSVIKALGGHVDPQRRILAMQDYLKHLKIDGNMAGETDR